MMLESKSTGKAVLLLVLSTNITTYVLDFKAAPQNNDI